MLASKSLMYCIYSPQMPPSPVSSVPPTAPTASPFPFESEISYIG